MFGMSPHAARCLDGVNLLAFSSNFTQVVSNRFNHSFRQRAAQWVALLRFTLPRLGRGGALCFAARGSR